MYLKRTYINDMFCNETYSFYAKSVSVDTGLVELIQGNMSSLQLTMNKLH